MSYDICPRGLRLPTIAESKALVGTYTTGTALAGSPFYGVYGGWDSGGSSTGFSGSSGHSHGYYWLAAYGSQGYSSGTVYYPYMMQMTAVRTDLPYTPDPAGAPTVSTMQSKYGGAIRCVNSSFDNSIRTMQDLGSLSGTNKTNALNKMTTGAYYTLSDSRDDKVYSISKLADGNVWMTKSLNLNGGITITSANSNVASNYILPLSSYSGWSSSSSEYAYNTDALECGSSACESYYSYRTVTAGTSPTSGSATYDICPKGWRLPTKAEYDTLATKYTTDAALNAAPFRSVYNGEMYDSGWSSYYTYYWTSTAKDSTRSYAFRHNTNITGSSPTTTEVFPYRGYQVRCILKP
jgi:uncharacterized protein (TIGR02145 family)